MNKLVLFLLLLVGCSGSNNVRDNTVTVTNLSRNLGGSGSIIEHRSDRSLILTNAHVCGAIKNGGFVIDDKGKSHLVINYRTSNLHDLCVIEIAANLKYSAKLAHRAPFKYEAAIISGHPKLLPTTVTTGEFTEKRVIPVMTGLRECTDEDREDPVTGLFCKIFGQVPLIKSYEAIAVSALIQPGSSGSAIYNTDGDIDAVVFAGSGDLGFAFAVPYEYVSRFLRFELETLTKKLPIDPNYDEQTKKEQSIVIGYLEYCSNIPEGSDFKPVCKIIESHYKRGYHAI